MGTMFEYDLCSVEVTLADYQSCNAAYPIRVYSTDKDTIKVYRPSHRFFIYGRAKNCQAGQKVNIKGAQGNVLVAAAIGSSVPSSYRSSVPSCQRKPSRAGQHAGWPSALAAVVCTTVFFLVG